MTRMTMRSTTATLQLYTLITSEGVELQTTTLKSEIKKSKTETLRKPQNLHTKPPNTEALKPEPAPLKATPQKPFQAG